jgi:hypothetical protein
MTIRRLSVILLFVASTLAAQSRGSRGGGIYRPGTGNPDEQLVPWKFVPTGSELVKGPFVVYWLPESMKDIEHSPLFTSTVLLEASARCVDFQIVTPDDAVNIARLAKPPAAMIMNDGRVVRQVSAARPKSVEQMVSAELSAREDEVFARLDRAKKEKSVELYRKIWDERCLYPLIGTEAQRGLKGLGVIVTEPPSTLAPDPNLKVTNPTKKP